MSSTARIDPSRSASNTAVLFVRGHAWPVGIWVAMAGWWLALFALVRAQYLGFEIGRFDLGNMVQAVWSTTEGRPLEMTTAAGEQIARLGLHVDPVLVLLAPLWLLVGSPLLLSGVQIAMVALGALPLFWLARKHLASERAAGLLALAYLASPWIAWNAYDVMHPKTLAIPLLLFAIWFLDNDRLLSFAVVAVLAASCGELMGMTIAGLGAWYAIARGRRRAGVSIAVAGAAWTIVALFLVVPAFSGGESVYYGQYDGVGGSPRGIAETAITDPAAIVSALTGSRDFLYLFLLALPLLGTFVLAPGLALVAVPQLVVNLLADAAGPTDPRHHYIAGVIPFLFAAAAIGLYRLAAGRRVALTGAILVVSLVLAGLVGPWPGPVERVPIRYELDAPIGHSDVLRRAVALVPAGAAVSSSNKVGSHLADRRYLFMVPVLGGTEARAEWVVLDTYDTWVSYRDYPFLVERPSAEIEEFRDRLLGDAAWEVVLDEAGVYVFRRPTA